MLSARLAFLIISISYVAGNDDKIVEQIYHGNLGTRNEFPFLARIYVRAKEVLPLCSGCIVAHNYVLTAAHCCAEPGKKYVVIGNVNQERFYEVAHKNKTLNVTGYWTYPVAKQHIHPKYQTRKFTVLHDVCILELEKPMTKADGHGVAAVSYSPFYAQQCTAVGWGQTEKNEMQFKLYHKKVFAESSWRGNWLLRLYFHTICSGDSGGPLICEGKVYGIASYSTTTVCSVPGLDYYAYLREEQDFLSQFVSGASSNSCKKLYCILSMLVLTQYRTFLLYEWISFSNN